MERAPSSYSTTTAVLASQLETIHAANMECWKRGEAASTEQRSQDQDGKKRLEEFRVLAETSSQRAGRRTNGRAVPKERLR